MPNKCQKDAIYQHKNILRKHRQAWIKNNEYFSFKLKMVHMRYCKNASKACAVRNYYLRVRRIVVYHLVSEWPKAHTLMIMRLPNKLERANPRALRPRQSRTDTTTSGTRARARANNRWNYFHFYYFQKGRMHSTKWIFLPKNRYIAGWNTKI